MSDPPPSPSVKLAERWYFGAATIGGSEESRSVFHALGAREGKTGTTFPPDDPHYPKARALGFLQNVVDAMFDLDAPNCHPLVALRIGRTLFAGLPGEPTIVAAHQIERALLTRDLDAVVVLPCTCDYGGYFATTAEYELQHYEGASTLWGRHSVPYLQARLTALVSKPPVPAHAKIVVFTTRDDRHRFNATDEIRAGVDPRPAPLSDDGNSFIRLRWTMADGARVVFGNGWWARVEQLVNGKWTPVMYGGRQLDDVNYPIWIERLPEGLVDPDRTEPWALQFERPADLPPGRYRIVLAPRSGFPGFAVEIPQTSLL